jgi:hypothetical protein
MKSSTLASYLESLATLIRSSKPGESLPRIKAHTHPRPTLEMSGTRVAGPLPIPTMDAEGLVFLAPCFPGIVGVVPQSATDAEVDSLRLRLADAQAQVARTLESHNETITQRDEARRELEALRRTVDRMRVSPSVTVTPAQAPKPLPPFPVDDLLSIILNETQAQAPAVDRPRPHFTITPVVLAFPPNAQGKTLAASAVTLDEVRALFAFKFLDPRDASKGGYWLAKDPTSPAVHALVATLTKHGAFTRDSIPA